MTETLFVHLGAHRTGTTHFQHTMRNNRPLLAQASCRFVNLQKVPNFKVAMLRMRKGVERRFRSARKRIERFATEYGKIIASNEAAAVVVLSSEGQLGEMGFKPNRRRLYPGHAKITAELKGIFAGRPAVIALSIRSYDEYIESTYKHSVRSSRLTKSFKAYMNRVDFDEISWVPMVTALVEAFGADNVVVWSFESYRNDLPAFYAWLLARLQVDLPPDSFQIDSKPANPSPSARLMTVQRVINNALAVAVPKRHSRKLAQRWNSQLGRKVIERRPRKPKLLPDTIKSDLKARYGRDLEEIRRLLPATSYL